METHGPSEALVSVRAAASDTTQGVIRLAERQPEGSSTSAASHAAESGFDIASAYGRFGRELYLFALNALGDAGAAEERTQETFTRAWRARRRFDPTQSSLRTWLFAIARNVIKDSFRRRRRIPQPVDQSRLAEPKATTPDPAESLMLIEALASLSTPHRQAVIAIHVIGMNYAELSESLDVPISTLRSRTFHGLRALRQHITSPEEDDD